MTLLVDLTIEIQDKLQTLSGKTIERAYVVSNSQKDVPNGNWYIMSAGRSSVKLGNADYGQLDVFLVYQRGLPGASNTFPDPTKNYTFIDGCLQEIEDMRRYFDEPNEDDEDAGAMTLCGQYGVLAGCSFQSYTNDPILDPVLFRDNHVFSSIIRLSYRP